MKFNPMTAQQAKDASTPEPLPAGEYDFEVLSAEETTSKSSGMGMFALVLKVFTPEDKFRQVRDYVMTEGKASWRLRQCCESVGLMMHYDRGNLEAADFDGVGGRCVLSIQSDPTGQYSPQNRVKTYLPAQGARPHAPRQAAAPRQMANVGAAADLDDEIPF